MRKEQKKQDEKLYNSCTNNVCAFGEDASQIQTPNPVDALHKIGKCEFYNVKWSDRILCLHLLGAGCWVLLLLGVCVQRNLARSRLHSKTTTDICEFRPNYAVSLSHNGS